MKRRVLIAMLATVVLLPVLATVTVYSLLNGGRASPTLASGPPPGRYKGSEPPAQIQMPQFALRNYKGRFIRSRELLGKVTLVTFLDTDCTTKCPIIAAQIGDGLRLLTQEERRDVVPLAFSVNPARDTPRGVRAFLHRRQAEGLDFLLGTVERLRPVWRSFHIVAAAETGNADIHSADVRVFDRRGIWVSTQHAGVDLTPSNLAHDLRVALGVNHGLGGA
ncbi:MAG: SCO family protein [Actinomycetota bacterium]|nr:SCO family protein [Actinomycetota bacterium]